MTDSIEDALAKARAIASRFSGDSSGDLGKRKMMDENDNKPISMDGSLLKRKKIYIPGNDKREIYLGLLLGPQGITQKQLQESSGATIVIRGKGSRNESEVGHPDDNDELHVCIEGSDDAIEKAGREIQQLLFSSGNSASAGNPSGFGNNNYGPGYGSEVQMVITVPNNLVGLLIGKGGENIIKMQVQTGAQMQIAKEYDMKPGDTTRNVTLKGSQSNVMELKKRIEEIISNRLHAEMHQGGSNSNAASMNMNMNMGSASNHYGNNVMVSSNTGITTATGSYYQNPSRNVGAQDQPFVIKVVVPNDKVGILIGKGGVTFKAIQEKTRANVHIPQAADMENPAVRTITIGAQSKESMVAAQMEIFNLLQQAQSLPHPTVASTPSNTLQIVLPDEKIGLVIGKGGCTLKDIQTRTQVRFQIPQSADPDSNPPIRTCGIVGTPEAQLLAKHELEMLLKTQVLTVAQYSSSGGMVQAGMMWGGGASVPGMAMQTPAGYYGLQNPQQNGSMYPGYDMGNAGGGATGAGVPGYFGAVPPNPGAGVAASPYGVAMMGGVPSQAYPYGQGAGAAVTPATNPTDPTAYHNEFWTYASYYGEPAARQYYGAWAPPMGSQPPMNRVGQQQQQQQQQQSQQSQQHAHGMHLKQGGQNISASSVQVGGRTMTAQQPQQVSNPAYELYKQQYKEWYEAYGRAAGADPNPPKQ